MSSAGCGHGPPRSVPAASGSRPPLPRIGKPKIRGLHTFIAECNSRRSQSIALKTSSQWSSGSLTKTGFPVSLVSRWLQDQPQKRPGNLPTSAFLAAVAVTLTGCRLGTRLAAADGACNGRPPRPRVDLRQEREAQVGAILIDDEAIDRYGPLPWSRDRLAELVASATRLRCAWRRTRFDTRRVNRPGGRHGACRRSRRCPGRECRRVQPGRLVAVAQRNPGRRFHRCTRLRRGRTQTASCAPFLPQNRDTGSPSPLSRSQRLGSSDRRW